MILNLVDAVKPWLAIESGTDCDGMRGGSVRVFWTKRAANAWLDHTQEWADGPIHGMVCFRWTRRARESVALFCAWNDDRDRFAERSGY